MKILFTDLDQTLFNREKDVTPATRDALAAMENAGNLWIPVSGRAPQSVITTFKQLGLYKPNMIVAGFNGGHLFDYGSNKTLFRNPLPIDDVMFFINKAKEAGIHCHTYAGDYVISEKQTPELDFYIEHVKMPMKIVPSIKDYLTEAPMKAVVMSLVGRSVLEPFRDSIREYTDGRFYSTFSADCLLEYSHIETNKGMAVKFLAEYFNVDINDTYAVGDEENDLPMLVAAGCGIAMANARDELKEKAAYVTAADNNHDGIAEIIYKFGLDK